jgi:YbbR domain-containing protein
MSWRIVTDDWKLKLLAVGLAVLMLGAVAFSQNPPTEKAFSLGLSYPNSTQNPVVLINPPSSITVTATGLADLLAIATAPNFTATADVSKAKAGSAQRLNVSVVSTIRGITVLQPAPIVVDIDSLTTTEVPVEVKAIAAPGWSVSSASATCPGAAKPNPCAVHFTGPTGWTKDLHAFVNYPGQISANTQTSPNRPILLQNSTLGYLDSGQCNKVTPPCGLDVTSVTARVDAVAGSTSSTVPLLDAAPSRPPANGFRVTAITITPNTVIINGDPVTLGKVRSIVLPAIDLNGRSSDYTTTVAIPYPDGVSGTVANATIKYSISANPNASPIPSP